MSYKLQVVDGVSIVTGSIPAVELAEMMLQYSQETNDSIADALLGQHYGAAMVWGTRKDCKALRGKLGIEV